MDLAAAQAVAAFMARAAGQAVAGFMAPAPAQAEAVFMARAIQVTKVVIISNLPKVISSNNSNSPGIRITRNS